MTVRANTANRVKNTMMWDRLRGERTQPLSPDRCSSIHAHDLRPLILISFLSAVDPPIIFVTQFTLRLEIIEPEQRVLITHPVLPHHVFTEYQNLARL